MKQKTRDKHVYAARLWGLQPRYLNVDAELVTSSSEAIGATLTSLSGINCRDGQNLDAVIAAGKKRFYQRRFSPTQVLWMGDTQLIRFNVRSEDSKRPLKLRFLTEQGDEFEERLVANDHIVFRPREIEGDEYLRCHFEIPSQLQSGHHQIFCRFEDEEKEEMSWLLVSPKSLKGTREPRQWGVFAPLYALKEKDDWGIGSFKELNHLMDEVDRQGGSYVALLPLLAGCNDSEDLDPSPYSPVTRLFWNEIYLDVMLAKEQLESMLDRKIDLELETDFESQIDGLREKDFVDFYAVYQLKKKYLKKMQKQFFNLQGPELKAWQIHLEENPDIIKYSEYRTKISGDAAEGEFHHFCQFLIDLQLKSLRKNHHSGLYLDLPIGVRRDSFDMEEFPKEFLMDSNAGAPPDSLFSGGQNWGFCPFHPQGIREQGYQYFSKIMRQHFRYGRYLRIDHVMGFHRIYTVPEGLDNSDGVYVGYKSDEFYASVLIQAAKVGGVVIGEDLGTVPEVVREQLSARGILRMWVLQMELGKNWEKTLENIPKDCQASINTHDMSPFAGFLKDIDLDVLTELELLDTEGAEKQRQERKTLKEDWPLVGEGHSLDDKSYFELYQLIIQKFANSPAQLVNLQLEDILGETRPQNVPGTWREFPNWRRRMTLTVSELATHNFANEVLKGLNETLQSKDKNNDSLHLVH